MWMEADYTQLLLTPDFSSLIVRDSNVYLWTSAFSFQFCCIWGGVEEDLFVVRSCFLDIIEFIRILFEGVIGRAGLSLAELYGYGGGRREEDGRRLENWQIQMQR